MHWNSRVFVKYLVHTGTKDHQNPACAVFNPLSIAAPPVPGHSDHILVSNCLGGRGVLDGRASAQACFPLPCHIQSLWNSLEVFPVIQTEAVFSSSFPLENDQGDPRAHGFLGSCLFSVLQPLYLHLLYAEHIESLWVLLQDMSAHFLLGSTHTAPCLVCLPLCANLR